MVNVKGTRRIRLAIELLCEKAGITDKDIDGLLAEKRRGSQPKEVKPLNVKETAKVIDAVTDLEGLVEFESDERKTVIDAVAAKKAELEKEE